MKPRPTWRLHMDRYRIGFGTCDFDARLYKRDELFQHMSEQHPDGHNGDYFVTTKAHRFRCGKHEPRFEMVEGLG